MSSVHKACDPGYDRWKRRDTAPTGSDQEANGEVTMALNGLEKK
jgi:hypothetical protein